MLETEPRVLVEVVDGLRDVLDRSVVGSQLPLQQAGQEGRRIQRSELTASGCTLPEVLQEWHWPSVCRYHPSLADDADNRDRLGIVGIRERRDLDVQEAAVIVGARPAGGTEQIRLRISRVPPAGRAVPRPPRRPARLHRSTAAGGAVPYCSRHRSGRSRDRPPWRGRGWHSQQPRLRPSPTPVPSPGDTRVRSFLRDSTTARTQTSRIAAVPSGRPPRTRRSRLSEARA